MIPVARPFIGDEELSAVGAVFNSGWLGLGSVVFEFEEALKGLLGVRNVIAVNTGTTAIHIALDSLAIGAGDEVIVPSLTYAASVQAITACGAIPVFCDIDVHTLNLDLTDAESRITSKTKAILPVHYCGVPCEMDGLRHLSRQNGLVIVEDAAHAFGSQYKGRMIGSIGDATCFSFDPIKIITCGEGGAVTIDDDELAETIRRKRILGIDKDTWHRYNHQRAWSYDVVEQGYRYHMSNINAAIGLCQLRHLKEFIARRQEVVLKYDESFSEISGLQLLERTPDVATFCYILKVKDGRDEFMKFLEGKGVGTGVHYIPNHTQSFFKCYATPLPVTEYVANQIVTLPLFNGITDEDVMQVIDAVRQYFRNK
jgi:perosamine synthetase